MTLFSLLEDKVGPGAVNTLTRVVSFILGDLATVI